MRETDLYQALHDFLTDQGYTVNAEVKNCDITATRGDELVIVEMKTRFSLDLLFQAADRQSMTDSVYVAVPGPVNLRRGGRWRKMKHIMRRLELGLIAVTLTGDTPRVDVVCQPLPYQRRKSSKKKRAILHEIHHRTSNQNQGGSVRTKLMTAYRESAIFIACCLEKHGPMSPKQLREMGGGPKTQSILAGNFYKWFERIGRGVYEITPLGKEELNKYPDTTNQFRKKLEEK